MLNYFFKEEINKEALKRQGFSISLSRASVYPYRFNGHSIYQMLNQKEQDVVSYVYNKYKADLKGIYFYDFLYCIVYGRLPAQYTTYTYWKPKSKYVKKTHHKKKVLSDKEILKREWKKKKQYKSERGVKKSWRWNAVDDSGNNRRHRRWAKSRIKKGDFDLSEGWKSYKQFKIDDVW